MNCPECGTNILKRKAWFFNLDSIEPFDVGIWHEYKGEAEPGNYVCENDHEFIIESE